MSGITLVHKNYNQDFDANIVHLKDTLKDSNHPDIFILPNLYFGEETNQDKIEKTLQDNKINKTLIFAIKNNCFVYEDKVLTRTNTFNFSGDIFNLITDENDIKTNCYFNVLLKNIPFDENIQNIIFDDTISLSISGVIGNNIFDGRGYISKNKTYELKRYEEISEHFSWRCLSNIQDVTRSKTYSGELYKGLVSAFRYFDAKLNVTNDLLHLFLMGVIKDSFKNPDIIFEENINDNIKWMASKYELVLSYGCDNISLPNLNVLKNLTDNQIIESINWRNNLSDLDIKGFKFNGIVHPYPEL